jgi:hypothetical protein
MRHLSKRALLAVGIVSALSFTQAAQAGNPLEQIVNQQVDKFQQRGSDRGRENEQYNNRQDDRGNRYDNRDNRHDHHGRHDDHNQNNSKSSCRDERNLRSTQGNVHTSMKFVNNTNQEVRTYWLDYSGRRVFYKAIPPHGNYTQPTFQTHPWVVTDQRDNCIDIFVSNQPSAVAEIR